ncbi:MAG: helix-turn-helix transcriptional regulator [Candidatus Methanomethyliaceae archaeon]
MKIIRHIGEKAETEKANISQGKLARMCGISRRHLKNIDTGTVDIKTSTLQKMCEALKGPVTVLFKGEN